MNKRDVVKWVPPVVVAVILPQHATASILVDISCDDLSGRSGLVSARANGLGGGYSTTITTPGKTTTFGLSAIISGSTRNGIIVSGGSVVPNGRCLTSISFTVTYSPTGVESLTLVFGG